MDHPVYGKKTVKVATHTLLKSLSRVHRYMVGRYDKTFWMLLFQVFFQLICQARDDGKNKTQHFQQLLLLHSMLKRE